MPDSLISVIIPTYNYGHYVTEAVESVLAQTYGGYEIVVVDDGSTDDTRARLAGYGDRIRYVYQDNQGLSAARNTGIRHARGGWIALLDSDDAWHPRKLEIQAAYLKEHPDVDLLASRHLDSPPGTWPAVLEGSWTAFPEPTRPAATRIRYQNLLLRSYFGVCSVVVRRRCFDEVGLFDPDLLSVEDRDMWIRIARRFTLARLELPLWRYRLHAESMTRKAARMEGYRRRVLRKACSGAEAPAPPLLLRMKAFSYSDLDAAFGYKEEGLHLKALGRILRSLLLWPLPYPRGVSLLPLLRLKILACVTGDLLHFGPSRRARGNRPEPTATECHA